MFLLNTDVDKNYPDIMVGYLNSEFFLIYKD